MLRLDAPRWQTLEAGRGNRGRWLRLTIASLHADRITYLPGDAAAPASAPSSSPPETLRLPIEIEIRAFNVDELRTGAGDDAFALVRCAADPLGDDGGALHRFAALQASHARATPRRRDRRRRSAFRDRARSAPRRQERAGLAGERPLPPSARGAERRRDRARPPPRRRTRRSPSTRAVVRPFEAWPLGELRASTEALDLSAFVAARRRRA